MFGWEFPPVKTGGLGTACAALTKGLARQGVGVTFVMPIIPENAKAPFVKLVGANQFAKNAKVISVPSTLAPYSTSEQYDKNYAPQNMKGIYGKNLVAEAKRFAQVAKIIARKEPHDVIHAHDWMTYEAGIEARKVSRKPLVAHIHATEYDRAAGHPNARIAKLERAGLQEANIIIANSEYTKRNICKHYKLPARKIRVVHWGIAYSTKQDQYRSPLSTRHKIVLFLGRLTRQKGIDQFITVAKNILRFEPETLFVIAGDGELLPRTIHRVQELGIADNVLFTGFLQGNDVNRAFQMADVYVMPSVSEPFGLVALESLANKTPAIISKQSGVSEVVRHCLKADSWDVHRMTDFIVNALRNKELRDELRENGTAEVRQLTIGSPARAVDKIYGEVSR
jgi:glycosyltransferase involved in cell wall biosynthesis